MWIIDRLGCRTTSAGGALFRPGQTAAGPPAQIPGPGPPRRRGGPGRSGAHGRTDSTWKAVHRPPLWHGTPPTVPPQDCWGVGQSQAPTTPTEAAERRRDKTWQSEGGRPADGGVKISHEACAGVGRRFWNPRFERTKVETQKWCLKELLPCFCLSLYFWVYDYPLFWFLTVWPSSIIGGPKI